ncbi:hypothetical protein KCV06_g141, partial [Aureobasidium melanogenum]
MIDIPQRVLFQDRPKPFEAVHRFVLPCGYQFLGAVDRLLNPKRESILLVDTDKPNIWALKYHAILSVDDLEAWSALCYCRFGSSQRQHCVTLIVDLIDSSCAGTGRVIGHVDTGYHTIAYSGPVIEFNDAVNFVPPLFSAPCDLSFAFKAGPSVVPVSRAHSAGDQKVGSISIGKRTRSKGLHEQERQYGASGSLTQGQLLLKRSAYMVGSKNNMSRVWGTRNVCFVKNFVEGSPYRKSVDGQRQPALEFAVSDHGCRICKRLKARGLHPTTTPNGNRARALATPPMMMHDKLRRGDNFPSHLAAPSHPRRPFRGAPLSRCRIPSTLAFALSRRATPITFLPFITMPQSDSPSAATSYGQVIEYIQDRLYLASYTHKPNAQTPFPYTNKSTSKSPSKRSARSQSTTAAATPSLPPTLVRYTSVTCTALLSCCMRCSETPRTRVDRLFSGATPTQGV